MSELYAPRLWFRRREKRRPQETGSILLLLRDYGHPLFIPRSADLKERLGRIIVAYTHDGQPVRLLTKSSGQWPIDEGSNQTQPGTNSGKYTGHNSQILSNIAHGCNSLIASKLGLLADYVVTEAGFGADLGLENSLT